MYIYINICLREAVSELESRLGGVVPHSMGSSSIACSAQPAGSSCRPCDAGAPGFNCRRRKRFALIRRDKNSERQAADGGVRMKGGWLSFFPRPGRSAPSFFRAVIACHGADECRTPPKPEHGEARTPGSPSMSGEAGRMLLIPLVFL